MTDTLLQAVRRYANAHSDAAGVGCTPIAGLTTIQLATRTELDYAIQRPLICLVLQGAKQVAVGDRVFALARGDSLLITADVPTASRIVQASAEAPYVSLVMDLDPAVIAELAMQMTAVRDAGLGPVRFESTDAEVAESALRLMRLLERPESRPLLQAQLIREFHYWLLAGRHGGAIRRLGLPDGHVRRVARAVALLRSDFAQPLPVERLAEAAGMSLSSFHRHFRAVTSLTPLQFQKQVRLIQARRLMLTDGLSASSAAFQVGYESVQQFTREYRRMFGLPPVRDVATLRGKLQLAA